MSGLRDDTPAYHVERDDSKTCPHCGRGVMWDVIGPDGVAQGVSFAEEADAEEYAAALSAAFEAGWEGAREFREIWQ